MSNLSYLSSLEEVIQASDEDLRAGIGFLAPGTVTEYVFHLRNEVREAREDTNKADVEIIRLQGAVETLQDNLDRSIMRNIHEYHKDVQLHSTVPATLNNTPYINNNSSVRPHRNLPSAPPEQPAFRPEVSAPPADDTVTETILLEKGLYGLGFRINGGYGTPCYPNDNKIYITKIIPNGVSEVDGRLKVNDCLLKVMDKALDNVTHEEAVYIINNSPPRVLLTIERRLVPRVIAVSLNKGDQGLGFSIAGGKGHQHIPDSDGIYIIKIIPGGAADKDGTLQIGNRILSVNNVNIEEVTHSDAVEAIQRAGDNVTLVIAQNIPEVYPDSAGTSGGFKPPSSHSPAKAAPLPSPGPAPASASAPMVQGSYRDLTEDLKQKQELNIGDLIKVEDLVAAMKSRDVSKLRRLCERVDKSSLQLLLQTGATKNEGTVIQVAAEIGDLQILTYLCEQGADIHARDNTNKTALHYAALKGKLDCLEYLCAHGADKNSKENHGRTPLHAAAQGGHLNCIQFLYETAGADINSCDDSKWTCLHSAVRNRHTEIVEYLVTRTDINVRQLNTGYSTAKDVAKENGYREIVDLIKRNTR